MLAMLLVDRVYGMGITGSWHSSDRAYVSLCSIIDGVGLVVPICSSRFSEDKESYVVFQ